jgi:hypothetical protein
MSMINPTLELKTVIIEIYGSPEPGLDLSGENELAELLFNGWEILSTDIIPTNSAVDLIGYQVVVLKRT